MGITEHRLAQRMWSRLGLVRRRFPLCQNGFSKELDGGLLRQGAYDDNGTNIHRRLSFQKLCNDSFKLEENLYL